jgi:2-desacetyl-2-hydroxyethyl bacteriochlorophyllide A dehydrogenase
MIVAHRKRTDEIDALVCVAPGRLEIARRPAPKRGKDEALVRPRRIGICGTDYHIFEGIHPFLEYPRVMGHELAVEVIDAPSWSGVRSGEICVVNPYLSCGECVACRAGKPNCCVKIAVLGVHRDGGMTSLLSLPAQNLIRADGLTLDECAAVEFLAIGAHAERRADVKAGDRVLVIGAGPIGLGAAIFSGLSEGTVTIIDVDLGRLKSACKITGATTVEARAPVADILAERTKGEGFEVVFDATGNPASMQRGFDFVAPGGKYVMISVVKESITFSDPDFHRREMTLMGSRNATWADFERVIDAIRGRMIRVETLITHRTTLSGAAASIPSWVKSKNGLIKAVVSIGT